MTENDINKLMAACSAVIKAYCEASCEPLRQRIAELESRPQLEYLGVYQENQQYRAQAAVTHDSQLWIARRATTKKPGGTDDWQLAIRGPSKGRSRS